jgi:hypothetical protein
MKVISKLLMFALVLSVFTGCKKEEENLPLEGIAGTYEGTLTVSIEENPIENVSLKITYESGTGAIINIPAGSIPVVPVAIEAKCTATSDKNKYSLSGTASVSIPAMGDLSVTISAESNIDKSGKASLKMQVKGIPGIEVANIEFDGQKK